MLSEQPEPSPFRFAEIAGDAGIDFVHFSGTTAEKYFPTANGSGVAMFDYDGDGRLDLYFATATLLPLGTARKGPNRLFKNLGGNRFRDVTESAGVGFAGFCHGIVVGDVDNDGDPDVFLCNYGPNVLFLNNGDGTFRDISKSAGIDRPNWSYGRRVPRLRQRRRPRPLRRQLRHLGAGRGRSVLRPARAEEGPALLLAELHPPGKAPALSQQRRPHLHRRLRPGDPHHRSRDEEAEAPIRRPRVRRGHGRPQRRRPGQHLRGQRHEPEFPLPQPRRRHVRGRHRVLRRGLRREGPGAVGHGRRRRGRQRRRTARPARDQLRQRVQHPAPEPGQRPVHGRDRLLRAGRRHHAVRRLGDRPGRLRQRRLARQLRRQRPRRRQSPGAGAAVSSTRSRRCSSST